MKAWLRYVVPIAFGLLIFVVIQFFQYPVAVETRILTCLFRAKANALPTHLPFSKRKIDQIKFEAKLSGKSVHDDVDLWSARGVATFGGTSQELTGPVFLGPNGKVRGIHFSRDRYPGEAVDLRIATLNSDEKLDWNEHFVFVYFNGASTKLSHPFSYRCDVTSGS